MAPSCQVWARMRRARGEAGRCPDVSDHFGASEQRHDLLGGYRDALLASVGSVAEGVPIVLDLCWGSAPPV